MPVIYHRPVGSCCPDSRGGGGWCAFILYGNIHKKRSAGICIITYPACRAFALPLVLNKQCPKPTPQTHGAKPYAIPWTRNTALLRYQSEVAKFDKPQINAVTTSFLYYVSVAHPLALAGFGRERRCKITKKFRYGRKNMPARKNGRGRNADGIATSQGV